MTDSPRKQHGLTLVEVLVAAIILAVGLIGLAGLQIQGLRVGQVAANGSTAGMLANQLAEHIRINASNAGSYTTLTSASCPPASTAQHLVDYCLAYDTVNSRYRSHSSNEAVAVTCLNCPNPIPRYQVSISWTDMSQTGNADDNVYAISFILSE